MFLSQGASVNYHTDIDYEVSNFALLYVHTYSSTRQAAKAVLTKIVTDVIWTLFILRRGPILSAQIE